MENNQFNWENQNYPNQNQIQDQNIMKSVNYVDNDQNNNSENTNQKIKSVPIQQKFINSQNCHQFHHIKQQIKQRIKNDHQLKKIQSAMMEDQTGNFQNNFNYLNQQEEEYIDNKIEAIISQIDEKKWKKINKRKHEVVKQQDNLIKKTKSYDDQFQINHFNRQSYQNYQEPIQEEEDNNQININININSINIQNNIKNFNQIQKRAQSPQSDRKARKRSYNNFQNSNTVQNKPIKIEFTNPYEEQEKLYQYILNKLDQQNSNSNSGNVNGKQVDESQENSSFSEDIINTSHNISCNSQQLDLHQNHFEVNFSNLGIQSQREIEDQKEIDDEQNQFNNLLQEQEFNQNNQFLDYMGQQIY